MNVVRGDDAKALTLGEFEQRIIALVIVRLIVADQLHQDVIAAEHVGQDAEFRRSSIERVSRSPGRAPS
jgi:hypothetical protein